MHAFRCLVIPQKQYLPTAAPPPKQVRETSRESLDFGAKFRSQFQTQHFLREGTAHETPPPLYHSQPGSRTEGTLCGNQIGSRREGPGGTGVQVSMAC